MRIRIAIAVLALGLAAHSCAGGGMATSAWNSLPQDILDDIDDAIWGVFDRCGGTMGTAFVVRHEGEKYLVTSLHVIRGFRLDEPLDEQLDVSRSEVHGKMRKQTTQTLTGVRLVHTDDIRDIAVMKTDGIDDLPALRLSRHDDERIRVFAIGLAQAVDYFGMSITEGIVSNPDKEVVVESRAFHQTHIEHTAFLVGGQSGGPLVDMYGRVVGVDSFARGQRGLHLFYATPLRAALDKMGTEGRVVIRNAGTARIESIYVTPFGSKPAEIDRLPREIGKVNGLSSVSFGIPEGRYAIRMNTEEKAPKVEEVEVKAGETTTIDYEFKDYGLRVINNGCQKILSLSLLNPLARSMMKRIVQDDSMPPEEKADRMRKLLISQDMLGKDILSPGQTWVEWVTDWDYELYAFTWDPSVGEFKMPDARYIKVVKGEVTNVYLND